MGLVLGLWLGLGLVLVLGLVKSIRLSATAGEAGAARAVFSHTPYVLSYLLTRNSRTTTD